MVHLEDGQFGQYLTHYKISSVSIFMRKYLHKKGDFAYKSFAQRGNPL